MYTYALLFSMPQVQRRRGSLVDPVVPGWRIERQAKERVETIAARAQMSASELVEQVILRLELTDQGIPPWVSPRDRDGELPIDAS